MSALAFNPWAVLETQHSPHPPPKAPNAANPRPGPPTSDPLTLGALAGLGGSCPALAENGPAPPSLVSLRDLTAATPQAEFASIRPRARDLSATLGAMALDADFLPNVPAAWCEGIALLASRPAPDGIGPPRWRAFQVRAARLLREHGSELHSNGWDRLDLFGLHHAAPAAHPPGWGLAWLLGAEGGVLDTSPAAVGMTREAGGARLALYKRSAPLRAGIIPAWDLPGASE